MTATNSAAPLPTLPATLPMVAGVPTQTGYAPAAAALPSARPIRTVRLANSGDAYAYADDAYSFSGALGNAPPDYGFDYGGAQPWAWQGYDDSRVFMEPVPNGYRYYYYRPGADEPYFVRDPDYGYGYDNGALAVIYGIGGVILPLAEYGPRLGYASRYLVRGEELYAASRGNERRAVIAANWAAREDAIAASRDRWAAAEAQQAGWQAYRARVADQQARHWAQEAARRDADARSFATWRGDGFNGAPPPRAIPAAWQQAPWAQDRARYAPVAHDMAAQQRFATEPGGGAQQGFPANTPAAPQRIDGARAADNRPDNAPREQRATLQPAPVQQHMAAQPIVQQRAADHPAATRQHARGIDPLESQPHTVPQRPTTSNRPLQVAHAERAPDPVIHVHRGAVQDAATDAPRQTAHNQPRIQRTPESARPPIVHTEQHQADRPPPAVHQAPLAAHAPPAQHSAPPPHISAPTPHPQGGGGGAHPSEGDHGKHH